MESVVYTTPSCLVHRHPTGPYHFSMGTFVTHLQLVLNHTQVEHFDANIPPSLYRHVPYYSLDEVDTDGVEECKGGDDTRVFENIARLAFGAEPVPVLQHDPTLRFRMSLTYKLLLLIPLLDHEIASVQQYRWQGMLHKYVQVVFVRSLLQSHPKRNAPELPYHLQRCETRFTEDVLYHAWELAMRVELIDPTSTFWLPAFHQLLDTRYVSPYFPKITPMNLAMGAVTEETVKHMQEDMKIEKENLQPHVFERQTNDRNYYSYADPQTTRIQELGARAVTLYTYRSYIVDCEENREAMAVLSSFVNP
jgi:hypothetical protein